ncbi:MAG: hypothetical protein Q9209_000494 [Squamulea sp. 1 TL-2023]
MGSHPRPYWFLVRPDNTITPLIAVDELPPNIQIAGVPAAMSLSDTKSMESVGVRERSIGTYEVQITSGEYSDSEKRVFTSDQSEIDISVEGSIGASESRVVGKPEDGLKEMSIKPLSGKIVQPSSIMSEHKQADKTSETKLSHLQDEEAANVEKWRQDVENPDETQAKIDAVIAANGMTSEEAQPGSKDENSRKDRAKAGLIPGKKVYCSHWIRNGDCDFVQQGCLYKHEMPDDDTLRAIGIRALPSWYIAAHPEKARKRGWGNGNRAGGPPSRTWKSTTSSFTAPTFQSSHLPLQAHLTPFQPPGPFGHSAKVGSSLLPSQSSYANTFTQAPIISRPDHHFGSPRVQELSDHQYQQWQDGTLDRPRGLQIVQKPSRSPGYKTFPFPVPAPMAAPVPATSHKEQKSVWSPRQSKFTRAAEEQSKSLQGKEDAGTSEPQPAPMNTEGNATKPFVPDRSTCDDQPLQLKSNTLAATCSGSTPQNVRHAVPPGTSTSQQTGTYNGFAPLEPSTLSEQLAPNLSTRERESNIPSGLFDSGLTVSQQAPRQMFSRTAREGQVSGSRIQDGTSRKRSAVTKEAEEIRQYDGTRSNEQCRIRIEKGLGHRNVTEDNKKKPSCSPEGKPKAKRAVKDRGASNELLLDYKD